MTSDYSIVKTSSKPNSTDFVSVTDYAVILQSGKKYLVVGFYNELNEKLDEVSFSVTELNEKGDEITSRTVDFIGIEAGGKQAFGPDRKVMLSDGCCDVKIKIIGGVYGRFIRRKEENGTVVDYKRNENRAYSDEKICDLANGKRHSSAALYRSDSFKTAIVAILAVVIACCAFFVYVNYFKASEKSFIQSGCEYVIVDDNGQKSVELSRYRGYGGSAVIPERFEEYKVTRIKSGAFSDVKNLRSIVIQGNPTIETGAFENFKSLKTVDLGNVTLLPDFAFRNCSSLVEIKSENLEKIGNSAFENCTALQSVSITTESGVTFGSSVFAKCSALKSFETIADFKFSTDKEDLFYGCNALASLKVYTLKKDYGYLKGLFGKTVPTLSELKIATMTEIPDEFCSSYSSLASVYVERLEKPVIGNRAFLNCSSLKELSVPLQIVYIGDEAFKNTAIPSFDGEKLEYIGKEAFSDNNALAEFTLNDNFAVVPNGLFNKCGGLKKVTLSDACVEIGASAFRNCSSLNDFVFPSDVEIIGNYAFSGCGALDKLLVPDTVRKIGVSAFSGCNSLSSIELPYLGNTPYDDHRFAYIFSTNGKGSEVPSSLKKVVLNGGEIYDEAFSGASSIERVVVNTPIETLGTRAFANCSSLKEVTVTGNLVSIGDGAFYYCRSLQSYRIPESVIQIGKGAFVGCSSLKDLTVPFLGAYSSAAGRIGYFFVDGDGRGAVPASLKKVTVTGGKIGDHAFDSCGYIEEVVLSGNLISVGNYAFADCYNLRIVTMPQSIREIGDYAFSGCKSLFSAALPKELRTIGTYAFEQCYAMKSVTLPETLTLIGDMAFDGCYHLYRVYNNSALHVVCGGDDGTVGKYALSVAPAGKEIPVTDIDGVEFTLADDGNAYVTDYTGDSDKITMPRSVYLNRRNFTSYKIADLLFCNSDNAGKVKVIDFGDAVTSIGNYSFFDCSALTSISVGVKIERIGNWAFYGCNSLKTADIARKSALNEIGYEVFGECSALTSFTVPDATKVIGESAFNGCGLLTDVDFGRGVTTIKNAAFNGCSSLQSVALPTTVQSIGESAFNGCSSMTKVEITGKLSDLGAYAFADCRSLAQITFGTENEFSVPDCAFYNCSSLLSAKLPVGTISIGNEAFAGCSSLQSAEFPDGLKNIGASAFVGSQLQSVNIPFSTENIGSYAFSSCNSLKSLTISAPNCKIEQGAFESCLSLETVKINASSISEYAFAQCNALQEARIESGVRSIGDAAFADCSAMELIVLPKTLVSIGYSAFSGCRSLYEIYNLSSLPLKCGVYGYGEVALNAYKIHSDINESPMEKARTDDSMFIRPDGRWILVRRNAEFDKLNFGKVTPYDGKIVSEYYVAASAMVDSDPVSLYIGKEVVGFDGNAFYGKTNIGSVEFASDCTITEIPEYAFDQCYNLKKVSFCDSVQVIGAYAFRNAILSETEKLPQNLTTICAQAFAYTGLKCLILPSSLRTIKDGAFLECPELLQIYNLSPLKISVGDASANGGVAAYALVVSDSLSVPRAVRYEYDVYSFIKYDNSWHLFRTGYIPTSCFLPDAAKLTDAGIGSYDILSGALSQYVYEVIIPECVTAIAKGAFVGDGVINAYYYGNSSQWKTLMTKSFFSAAQTYYYVDCVHSEGEWTYDKYGGTDTVVKKFELIKEQQPTCTERGKKIYRCPYCPEERVEYAGDPIGHSYENGVCKNCGKKQDDGNANGVSGVRTEQYVDDIKKLRVKRSATTIYPINAKRRYAI